MIPTFMDRVKARMCQWFGHKESLDAANQSISCTRCRRLLAGPLNMEAYLRSRKSGKAVKEV